MLLMRLYIRLAPCLLVLLSACSGPTGEYKVALVPARGGQRGFYMVNSDSTGARLISTPGSVQLRLNSWSPDGRKIAYFSVGPGDALIMNNYRIPSHFLLYAMDATGAGQRRLLDFPVSSFTWSPDSNQIAVVSAYEDPQREDSEIVRGSRQPVSAIYLFNLRTGQQSRVTPYGSHCSAAWSPDGTRLALSFGDDPKRSRVIVATLDGKHTRPLTDAATIDIYPAWSPDGKRLAYVAASVPGEETPGAGIYVVDADGANKKRVTDMMISEVSWSPDGKTLLLQAVNGLYVIPADGGNPVKVSSFIDRPLDAVFTPDGRKVMFRSNHEGDWHLYTVDLNGANLKRALGQLSASQFCLSPLIH